MNLVYHILVVIIVRVDWLAEVNKEADIVSDVLTARTSSGSMHQ